MTTKKTGKKPAKKEGSLGLVSQIKSLSIPGLQIEDKVTVDSIADIAVSRAEMQIEAQIINVQKEIKQLETKAKGLGNQLDKRIKDAIEKNIPIYTHDHCIELIFKPSPYIYMDARYPISINLKYHDSYPNTALNLDKDGLSKLAKNKAESVSGIYLHVSIANIAAYVKLVEEVSTKDLNDQIEAINNEMQKLIEESSELRAKKSRIPTLARRMKADMAQRNLESTEEGRAFMESLEGTVKLFLE